MSEQKTHAEIIAEMRDLSEKAKLSPLPFIGNKSIVAILKESADRIEAAYRREKAAMEADALEVGGIIGASRATAEKSSAVGDCAKMRAALEELVDNIEMRASVFGIFSIIDRKTFLDAKSALTAPPRNCDVGTAEEQGRRCMAQFDQWRRKGDGMKLITAIMAWAQMPYKEGGIK